jgi:hypothetical protein
MHAGCINTKGAGGFCWEFVTVMNKYSVSGEGVVLPECIATTGEKQIPPLRYGMTRATYRGRFGVDVD